MASNRWMMYVTVAAGLAIVDLIANKGSWTAAAILMLCAAAVSKEE